MKKNEGSLTIEATISLSVFIFFMMAMVNFGQIYKAQVYMTHRLLQAGKMVSYMSYDYDNGSGLDAIWSMIKQMTGLSVGIETEWIVLGASGANNYSRCVERAFYNLKGNGDFEDPDMIMNHYGIENIEIHAQKDDSDLTMLVTYDIKLAFRFFGVERISLKQSARCGLWGEK